MEEVEGIDAEETLEEMALASQDDEDVISDTVSLRLESIRASTIRTGTDSRNTGSYRSALSRIPATIDEVITELMNEARPRNKPLLKSYK